MEAPSIISREEGGISKGKVGALLLVLAALFKLVADYLATGMIDPTQFQTLVTLMGGFMGIMGYGIRDAL